ncbi:EAL domain-containing protein [Chitinibacter bivalviorum]|uniref:EAL domain-containing protein n=1 Tax=Chitinibacter bivalviorum TaxID=2739434 RepID=A0A7H9BIV1_9NEIS|nr:EAL domain-containing protein [Chitinibacter bivalviorum]QLG88575.1 EAL domain-containing protein [Chitinibacter bivalviorum]
MPRNRLNQQVEETGYSFGRIRKVLVILSLCVCFIALAILAQSIWRSRSETLAKSEQEMLLLARTMEEHVGRTMEGTLSSLNSIERDEVFNSCVAAKDAACLHAYMQRTVARYPQMNSIALAYPDGELAASNLQHPVSPHNLSSLQYFRATRSRPQSPYYIGEQQPDPTGMRDTIPFTTGLIDKQTKFTGVLIAGLDPDYYQQFYDSINLNRGLVIRLFRDDGISLVRFPVAKEEIGRDISQRDFFDKVFRDTPSGVFYETSKSDQVTRIFGWRRVQGWPMGVSVGIDRELVLAPWRQETMVNVAIALLLLLSGAGLLLYVLQQLHRLERTEADLYLTKVAVENGADMAVWLDPQGHIRYVNATSCKRLGYGERDLLGMRFRDINPNFKAETWPKFWQRLRHHRHLFDEITLRTRTGEEFPSEVYSNYILFKGQEYNCAVVRDISERRMAEEAIVKSEQQLRLALEASSTGLFDMPLDGRRTAVTSPEYDKLLGYQPGELIETFEKWKEQLHPTDREQAVSAYRDYYVGNSAQFAVDFRRRVKSGEYLWFQTRGKFVDFDSRGKPSRLIGTMTDITERKEAQDKITELANFDTVTGLANRNLLRDELRLALASAERYKRKLALLFLDLDRFKTINDSLGHAAGDMVLAQVASRLRSIVGKQDILSRLGGDEFVLVLADLPNVLVAGDVADRILSSFGEAFHLEAGNFATSTSIGISVYPDDGQDADELIKNADVAMYQAKNNGRNNYQFFTADMNARASERLSIEANMRDALSRGEFEVYFQPQVSLSHGKIIGAEALVRWNHPEQGLIPPGKFIPIAEESRMIVPLGNWVLRRSCELAAQWQRDGLPPITVAVNLSPLQLHQANLLELIQEALDIAGLDAKYLELEVTESVVMQEVEHVMTMLHGIKQLGVKLSLDDFGTGYSSLSYLKRFAFDKLKVDQSFVRDISSDPNDAAIVLAIIGLGKTLGMSVLAEGVETEAQLEFLCRGETDSIQGFLFSKPIQAEPFKKLLMEQKQLTLPDISVPSY